MSKKQPPSMRDFDYFSDSAKPAAVGDVAALNDLPPGLETQLAQFRSQAKRQRRAVFISAAFFAVVCWFVYGFKDEMAYAFSSPRLPKDLGNVTELSPTDLQHNDYVRIVGITEHRGLTQKLVRGVGLARQEYWYLRLVGSKGIFVEVPPDPERYGFATRVKVEGRVVDGLRDPVYRALIERYQERYFTPNHPHVRLVQAGLAPGDKRLGFVLMLSVLGLIALLNVLSLLKLVRTYRQRPIIGG